MYLNFHCSLPSSILQLNCIPFICNSLQVNDSCDYIVLQLNYLLGGKNAMCTILSISQAAISSSSGKILEPKMYEKSCIWTHKKAKILKMVGEEFDFSHNQKQSPGGVLQTARLKSFTKLTGKLVCQSLFFIKLQ